MVATGSLQLIRARSAISGASGRRLRRLLTSPLRKLPDYAIIGAQKCGTTFLHRVLGWHPNVEPASAKEIHYFDLNFGRGINWYKSHFPLSPVKERRFITGEASPYYLFHPHAAARMAQTAPKVRLILLLRDPVDRAYSHYQHRVRKGIETLSFEEALEAEEQRLRGELEKMMVDELYNSYNHQHFSYVSRGVYIDQIKDWSHHFGDDHMLVVQSKDLFDYPSRTLQRILTFLDLPRWTPKVFRVRTEDRYEPMSPATRERLAEYFEPHNRRLYEYLDEDFGW